jgi:colanic acid/amylovoran biosynthesis protein
LPVKGAKENMNVLVTNIVSLNMRDKAILDGMKTAFFDAWGKDIDIVVSDADSVSSSIEYSGYSFIPYISEVKGSAIRNLNIPKIRSKEALRWFDNLRFWFGVWLLKSKYFTISRSILTKREYRVITKYNDADIIVSTGGTYLVENYRLEKRILDYRLSMFLNKPLVFYTQTLGPFTKPEYVKEFKKIFDSSPAILLRDSKSAKHIKDIGSSNGNIHILADAAFSLPGPENILQPSAKFSKVAISVRDWKYFKSKTYNKGMEDYLNAIKSTVERLVIEEGAEVTFVSTCQGRPEYNYDDSEVAQQVFHKLPKNVQEYVWVDRKSRDPKSFINFVSKFDIMIATRMHAAILALNSCRPVVPIAYEFKTKELFKNMDLKRWVVDIESIEKIDMYEHVLNCLRWSSDHHEFIIGKVNEQKRSAASASRIIAEII